MQYSGRPQCQKHKNKRKRVSERIGGIIPNVLLCSTNNSSGEQNRKFHVCVCERNKPWSGCFLSKTRRAAKNRYADVRRYRDSAVWHRPLATTTPRNTLVRNTSTRTGKSCCPLLIALVPWAHCPLPIASPARLEARRPVQNCSGKTSRRFAADTFSGLNCSGRC